MSYDREKLEAFEKDNAKLKEKIQDLNKSETFWQNKLAQEKEKLNNEFIKDMK